jgi:hypothetical protein
MSYFLWVFMIPLPTLVSGIFLIAHCTDGEFGTSDLNKNRSRVVKNNNFLCKN